MQSPQTWLGLAPRITSRVLNVNDLEMHILETFPEKHTETTGQTIYPLILLLHGFPELAYSWRKIMGPLADAHEGYHTAAPDLRGFGRTVARSNIRPETAAPPDSSGKSQSDECKGGTIRPISYDEPLAPFHILNIAADIKALVHALGYQSVALLAGHDFGSRVAVHLAISYPDMIESIVFLSAPFTGVTLGGIGSSAIPDHKSPSRARYNDTVSSSASSIATALAGLTPPYKHYTYYFSTRHAGVDMQGPPEGLQAFFWAYMYAKSGSWVGNGPHPLPHASSPSVTIEELAKDLLHLPEYYVMPLHAGMPEVVAQIATSSVDLTSQGWLSDEEISVYATEYRRTGFQGGLNYYRSMIAPTSPEWADEVCALIGRRVGVPAAFIAGSRDWNVYQVPGAEKKMRELMLSADDSSFVLVPGAGHWVQQEAPEEVVNAIVNFLTRVTTSPCEEVDDCRQ